MRSFYTDVLCESFRGNKTCNNVALQKQMTIMNNLFKTAFDGTSIFHAIIFQMKSNHDILKERRTSYKISTNRDLKLHFWGELFL